MKCFYNVNRSFFKRLLFSYFVVFIIPILVGILAYRESLRIVEEDSIRFNMSLLRQSRDIMDRRLSEADAIIKMIASNPYISTLGSVEGGLQGSDDVYKVWCAYQYLSNIRSINNIALDYFVFYINNDIVLSTYLGAVSNQGFYGQSFEYRDVTYREWRDIILGRYLDRYYLPSGNVKISGIQCAAIPYVRSIPLEYTRKPKGSIVALLDEKQVLNTMSGLDIGSDGWFYIADREGRVILPVHRSNGNMKPVDIRTDRSEGFFTEKILGEEMIVSYAVSSYNGWRYIAVLPARSVMSKASYIKKLVWVVVALSITSGLLVAFILAYRNAKPIRDILTLLQISLGDETLQGKNECDCLHSTVSRLIDRNSNLQNAIREQTPLLRAAFMERLINGKFHDRDEIQAFICHLNVKLYGNAFMISILKFGDYQGNIDKEILKEYDIHKAVIKDYINSRYPDIIITHDLSENRLALLFKFDYKDRSKCISTAETVIMEVHTDLLVRYNIKTLFAVGDLYENILQVCHSYEDALKALEYMDKYREKFVVWYSSIPKDGKGYYYPIETEIRLINNTKAGNEDDVMELLDEIYMENFVTRLLDPDMIQQLFFAMRGTIFRLFEQTNISCKADHILKGLIQTSKVQEWYKSIVEVYSDMCREVNMQKKINDANIKRNILDYINSSYMRCNFQLRDLALEFHLSESYLYHFFKRETGLSFAEYVEHLRVELSSKLLMESDLTVNEIAKRSGYNSTYSFRRAFKRAKGVLPTDYRESMSI